jgi:hypothetical protein
MLKDNILTDESLLLSGRIRSHLDLETVIVIIETMIEIFCHCFGNCKHSKFGER